MKIISLLILATLIGCINHDDPNIMAANKKELAGPGCTNHDDPNIMAANKKELAGPGENVGVLPDGRNIIRYRLEMGDNFSDHWIYVVDGSDSTTLNVRHNKSHYVEVIIDGQKYSLSLAEAE